MGKQQQQGKGIPAQINTFIKGLVTDMDVMNVGHDQWISASNIRIADKGGNDYIITNMDGNDIAFTLPNGYIPIGNCEYNGIMYIAAVDKLSEDSNVLSGIIGSYPSPVYVLGGSRNYNNLTFENNFKPLHNFNTGTIVDLQTPLFNFHRSRQLIMTPILDYDDTVNITFTDDNNPIRVVNTGFKQNGNLVDRLIVPDDFITTLNAIPTINDVAKILAVYPYVGGNLKYGHYFFFLRYCTSNFLRTHFFAKSFAVAIEQGDYLADNRANVHGGDGALTASHSDKKVQLDISCVNPNYNFVEIGFVRYYSDPNGQMIYETGVFDKQFSIVNGYNYLTITGNESILDLTFDELVQPLTLERTCKDMIYLQDRMVGSNWKEKQVHNDQLRAFAAGIQLTLNVTEKLNSDPYLPGDNHSTPDNKLNNGYINPVLIYDHVGYFRGETYCFEVKYALTDGSITDGYRVCGGDSLAHTLSDTSWYEILTTPTYPSGILRMPDVHHCPLLNQTGSVPPDDLDILGVTPNMTTAYSYLATLQDTSWFKQNVKSIIFTRAERKKTLQYQGLMFHCSVPEIHDTEYWLTQEYQNSTFNLTHDNAGISHQIGANISGAYAGLYLQAWEAFYNRDSPPWWGAYEAGLGGPTSSVITTKLFPIWRGYMPMHYVNNYNADGTPLIHRYYTSRFFAKRNKYAFYSPDFFLNTRNDPLDISMIRSVAEFPFNIGGTGWNNSFITTVNIFPGIILTEPTTMTFNSNRQAKYFGKEIIGEVNDDKVSGNKPFINYGSEGDLPDTIFYKIDASAGNEYWSTREVRAAKYISIDLEGSNNEDPTTFNTPFEPDGVSVNNFGLRLVNSYSQDIYLLAFADLKVWYDKVPFYDITPALDRIITPYSNGSTTYIWTFNVPGSIWNGDCFLQRAYFKQQYWWTTDENDTDQMDYGDAGGTVGANKNFHKHGLIIGFPCECQYNHNLKMLSQDGNTFYPAKSEQDFAPMNYNAHNAESFLFNNGYNRILPPGESFTHDYRIPSLDKIYQTRIRWSENRISGAIVDYTRQWKIANYRDFDFEDGAIIAIASPYEFLMAIHERGIHRLNFNERTQQINSAGETYLMGSGDMLPVQTMKLSHFGSQHLFSINRVGPDVYGIDMNKRILWKIGTKMSDYRGLFPIVMPLSEMHMVEKLLFDLFPGDDDIREYQQDNPVCGYGITTGYNKRFEEVSYTIHKTLKITGIFISIWSQFVQLWEKFYCPGIDFTQEPYNLGAGLIVEVIGVQDSSINATYTIDHIENGDTLWFLPTTSYSGQNFPAYILFKVADKTIVYNEKLDLFYGGDYSYTPGMYFNINNDFFSSQIYDPNNDTQKLVYQHDDPREAFVTNYYGVPYPWFIEFVVNGDDPGTKYFENHIVDCPIHVLPQGQHPTAPRYYLFDKIDYTTLNGTITHTPVNEISDDLVSVAAHQNWIDPRYNEDRMFTPIMKSSDEGQVVRPVMGIWLKIKFTFARPLRTYIKNVITFYKQSKA